MTKPTKDTYDAMQQAFDFYNKRLFDNRLPPVVFVMVRRKKTLGYFIPDTWGQGMDGETDTAEIALNPDALRLRPIEDTLSTVVHEMCHLEQHVFGTPSNGGYHNKEWADMMDAVGLTPSHTGEEGGKRTGPRMTHFIAPQSVFSSATSELIKKGFDIPWTSEPRLTNKKKAASKTKYTCGQCEVNAWAKPEANIWCGDCDEQMESEE